MIRKIFLSLLVFLLMTATSEAANLSDMAKVGGVRWSYGSGTVRIVIDLTKKVEFVETTAENPSRSIIDIKNAWIDPADKIETKLESLAAKNLRVAQFDTETVRVVIETMAAIKPFILEGGNSGWRLVIDVGNAPFKENPELNNPPPKETPKPAETKVETEKERQEREKQEKLAQQEREKQERQAQKEREKQEKQAQKEREKQEKQAQKERERQEKLAQKERERQEKERAKQEREKAKQEKANQEKADKDNPPATVNPPTGIDKDLSELTGLKGKIIVIDPGHGGNDSGAIGPTGVMEKTVTLNVALELEKLLTAEGAKVIMTRTTDKTVSPNGAAASDIEELQARCDVANSAKADIFVSIHADSFTKPDAKGTTGYYYGQSEDDKSKQLADSIRKALCEQIKTPSRGTKACNFYVVRHTDMPATLIELAFISNPEEEQILNSADGILKAARGIFDGIEDYFG